MAKIIGDVDIDVEQCKGCEICVQECPYGTLAMSKKVNSKGYHFVEKVLDNCIGCANCAVVCPDAVITVYRAKE